MSACMPGDNAPVSKEAPSHKLLFARDINEYRGMIYDWYERVQKMPQVTDQDLNCYMHGLSQRHASMNFNQTAALKETFLYVSQYVEELSAAFNIANPGGLTLNRGGGLETMSLASSTYTSSQHIYQSPQSPSLQPHQDFSSRMERIFKIVKDNNDHYVMS